MPIGIVARDLDATIQHDIGGGPSAAGIRIRAQRSIQRHPVAYLPTARDLGLPLEIFDALPEAASAPDATWSG